MTPVLTRHAPEPVRNLGRAAPALLVVALVATSALLLSLVARPTTIDELVVTNRSRAQLEISVGTGGDPSRLFVAAVEPRSEARIDDVLDQGETWVVRADHAGTTVGELRISRRQLEHRGWRVTIPARWGAQGAHGA